jgi:hypothetical protein
LELILIAARHVKGFWLHWASLTLLPTHVPLTAICTALYNNCTIGFKNCKNALFLSSTILEGRDTIEEFVADEVWPISDGWKLSNIVFLDVDWASQQVSFP